MSEPLRCMHYRIYRSSCLNDGKCANQARDYDGHKYCKTDGIIQIQTSINIYRESTITRRDNGD